MVSYNDRCRGGDAGDKIVYLNEAFAGIAQKGVFCCNSYDFRTSRIGNGDTPETLLSRDHAGL